MKTISICTMTKDTVSLLNTIPAEFAVTEILDVERTGFGDTLYFKPANAYRKQYDYDTVDPRTFLDNTDRVVFLAFEDATIVGQIVLRSNWNKFAWVEDLTVRESLRRRGIGRGLLDRGIRWAADSSLSGMALETQDVNAAACRFYSRCGLKIGGYDRFLYRSFPDVSSEIAVYWYYLFE